MKLLKIQTIGALIIGICLALSGLAQGNISNYKVYIATGNYNGKQILVTRKFEQNGLPIFLYVDVNTLTTNIANGNSLTIMPSTWQQATTLYSTTPYFKALSRAKNQSFALQDAGIVHGYPKEKGITLTIDLCPSHKPLDRIIFTSLINEFKKIEKPVPLALSLSGRFMLTHGQDIDWLKALERAGNLDITWVNHTYNHYYNPNVPLTNNFLLAPGVDVNFEVLEVEVAMLQKGIIPSVFFRFPGLVSDNGIVDKIWGYGLIPIGSDAWLAKGQAVGSGSIVLIHGNGNEPIGVKDFIKLLQTNKRQVTQKQWLMYDLRESLKDEFKN